MLLLRPAVGPPATVPSRRIRNRARCSTEPAEPDALRTDSHSDLHTEV